MINQALREYNRENNIQNLIYLTQIAERHRISLFFLIKEVNDISKYDTEIADVFMCFPKSRTSFEIDCYLLGRRPPPKEPFYLKGMASRSPSYEEEYGRWDLGAISSKELEDRLKYVGAYDRNKYFVYTKADIIHKRPSVKIKDITINPLLIAYMWSRYYLPEEVFNTIRLNFENYAFIEDRDYQEIVPPKNFGEKYISKISI